MCQQTEPLLHQCGVCVKLKSLVKQHFSAFHSNLQIVISVSDKHLIRRKRLGKYRKRASEKAKVIPGQDSTVKTETLQPRESSEVQLLSETPVHNEPDCDVSFPGAEFVAVPDDTRQTRKSTRVTKPVNYKLPNVNIKLEDVHGDQDNINYEALNTIDTIQEAMVSSIKAELLEKSLFNCVLCGKNFSTRKALRMHVRKHATDNDFSESEASSDETSTKSRKTFKCKLCDKTFRHKGHHKNHMNKMHSGKKRTSNKKVKPKPVTESDEETEIDSTGSGNETEPLEATDFPEVDENESYQARADHEKQHVVANERRPYACDICPKAFRTKANLKEHKVRHQDPKPFVCHCGQAFANEEFLHKHELRHEVPKLPKKETDKFGKVKARSTPRKNKEWKMANMGDADWKHKCSDCGQVFKEEQGLVAHQLTDVDTGVEIECPVCMDSFKSEDCMRHHELSHDQERPHVCNCCSKGFKQKGHLWEHRFIHTDEKIVCSDCGESFTSKRYLKNHKRNHHESKAFPCTECDKSFAFHNQLVHHIGRHHASSIDSTDRLINNEVDPMYKYKCDRCDKVFLEEGLLEAHKEKMDSSLDYKCDKCEVACHSEACSEHHKMFHDPDRKWVCNVCSKGFKQKAHLWEHKFLHMQRSFSCELCGEAFTSKKYLKNHKMSKHEEKIQVYACSKCRKKFATASALVTHEKCHEDGAKYQCEICKESFEDSVSLWEHLEVHLEGMEKPFVCNISQCEKKFPSESYLNKHIRYTHSMSGKTTHECEICDKVFTARSALLMHMRVHGLERPFVCEICNKSFKQPGHLHEHRQTHGEKSHLCEDCGESFASKKRLKGHRETMHEERKFKCSECPSTFPRRRGLEIHMCIHTGEKPFSCEYCGKGFVDKGNLNQHIRTHTGKKYACEYCGKRFFNRGHLTQHIHIHTGYKPFKCTVCDYKCTQSPSLKKHMLLHTGVHNYSCETCGKKFKDKKGMQTHINRVHLKIKTKECKICGKMFNDNGMLRDHLTTHSNFRPFDCLLCGSAFKRRDTLRQHMHGHHKDKTWSYTSYKLQKAAMEQTAQSDNPDALTLKEDLNDGNIEQVKAMPYDSSEYLSQGSSLLLI